MQLLEDNINSYQQSNRHLREHVLDLQRDNEEVIMERDGALIELVSKMRQLLRLSNTFDAFVGSLLVDGVTAHSIFNKC